jgi:hypothetical protein
MAPTNPLNTHKVMANGSQTSKPANMYFLMFMGCGIEDQWQAQDGAQALAVAAGVSVLAGALLGGASAAGALVPSLVAGVAAGALLDLKSVAYQPEPLS